MRLILVRHGQTPSNLDGRIDTGAPGPSLTELGRRQAADLVNALAGERIDVIYASNLKRTQETALPIARERALDVNIDSRLREIEAGDLDGLTGAEAHDQYVQTALGWVAGGVETSIPGGENGLQFFDRFDAALAATDQGTEQTVLVVTHGASIHTWIAGRARNAVEERTNDRPIANTGIVIVEGSPAAGWSLAAWNGEPTALASAASASADPVGAPPNAL